MGILFFLWWRDISTLSLRIFPPGWTPQCFRCKNLRKRKELAAGCDAELLSSPSGSSMDEGQEGEETTAGWQSLRSMPSWMLVGVEHTLLAALLLSLHFPTTNDGRCFIKRKIHVTPPKTDKKTPKMMVWKLWLLLTIAIFGIYIKSQWCSSLEILKVFFDFETFPMVKLKKVPPQKWIQGWIFVWTLPLRTRERE